mmetsp:Transcript_95823/g.310524  ORF Transcript_95823/g.310524 Transcript_95823/m.310524 type:complete len:212 (-) Transcript_95823:1396-2031(-)
MRNSVSEVCWKQEPRTLSSPLSPLAITGKPSSRFPQPFSRHHRPSARTSAERTPEATPRKTLGRPASAEEGGTLSIGSTARSAGKPPERLQVAAPALVALTSAASCRSQSKAGIAGTTALAYSSPRCASGCRRASARATPSARGAPAAGRAQLAGSAETWPGTGARKTGKQPKKRDSSTSSSAAAMQTAQFVCEASRTKVRSLRASGMPIS